MISVVSRVGLSLARVKYRSFAGLELESRSISTLLDMRSDTVSKPCDAMREAIFQAPVGDDVFGEDPSVKKLQEMTAELCGMEEALYFPSGTSANLCALGAHCERGHEIICGQDSHIFIYEGGGASSLLSIAFNTVKNNDDGTMDIDEVESRIRKDDFHHPITGVVAVENTHNIKGGKCLPPDYLSELKAMCNRHRLPLHMDGARLWNASAASGVPIKELLKDVDTVSLCYSKGLGAPVGSVLAGPSSFIAKARRLRKVTGGGMRQAGLLAAAAIYALEHNFPRMQEDHRRLEEIRAALSQLAGLVVPPSVDSNILFFEVDNGPALVEALESRHGLLLGSYGPRRVRITTHPNIGDEDAQRVIRALSTEVRNMRI